MKHNQQGNIYEVEVLLHYLSGNMNREEMYAIERAALDDEMLADAIDGFRAMRKTMSDEAILAKVKPTIVIGNQHLPVNQAASHVVKINSIKRIVYAAAAIIILGAGWWIFNERIINNDASNDEIASVQSVEVMPENLNPKKVDGTKNDEEASLDTIEHAAASIAAIDPVKPKVQPPASATTPPPAVIAEAGKTDNSKATAAMADEQMARLNNERQLAEMREEKPVEIAESSRRLMAKQVPTTTIQVVAPADTNTAVPAMGWSNLIKQLELPAYKSSSNESITVEWMVNEAGKNEQITIHAPYTSAQKRALMQIINQTEPWKVKEGKPVKVQLRIE